MASYLFQGNPDRFDIDGYLQAAIDQDREISWSVKQHKNSIQPGDTVYLWRAAGKDRNESGVIAQAVCVSQVDLTAPDSFAQSYWKDPPNTESRVKLELQSLNLKHKKIIKKEWIEEDPQLKDLSILKQAQGTNFVITKSESSRLDDLSYKELELIGREVRALPSYGLSTNLKASLFPSCLAHPLPIPL